MNDDAADARCDWLSSRIAALPPSEIVIPSSVSFPAVPNTLNNCVAFTPVLMPLSVFGPCSLIAVVIVS